MSRKIKIETIKNKMLKWKDFYGGDIIDSGEINAATTREELYAILNKHENFMESMLADALSHISHFKKGLGLHII